MLRYLWMKLKELEKKFDEILEVRGAGLLLGLKTKSNNLEINNLLTKMVYYVFLLQIILLD